VSRRRNQPRASTKRGRLVSLPEPDSGFLSPESSPDALPSEYRHTIRDLVELLRQHDLSELEVERRGFRIRVCRDTRPGHMVTVERATASPEVSEESRAVASPENLSGKVTVTSPIVGTFYRSPSPDADPYVEEGDLVKKGQVLCIVEAMKLMNEIEAEVDGRIVKILAESTKPVEYGQPLFLVDPAPAS
jgi:acetyl-CoA carboxylase biotin carboxyl carrier protein